MADPVSAGIMVGGSLIKGVAGYRAGKYNKRLAYNEATNTERDGTVQEARVRDAARLAMGDQVSAQFSNGFYGGSGSALDALTQSQINATLDALTIRRDAAARARAQREQGDQAKRAGNNALLEGLLGAGATAIRMKSDWANARRGTTAGGG